MTHAGVPLRDMPSQAILTIAIPTYNRASQLERQLRRLCGQNDERVVVLVSDNGSTDTTPEVVQHFEAEMPNLVYIRNPKNLGFDRNLLRLYEAASSEYVWFLSDDDSILPNAVDRVIAFVLHYTPTVAVLGCQQDRQSSTTVENDGPPVQVIDSLECMKDYGLLTSTIPLSTLVFRKNPAVIPAELSALTGTNFFQVSLSLVLLSRRFRFCLATRIMVVTRETGYVTRVEIANLWFVGPARAMHLPQYGYDPQKVRWCISKTWKLFVILLLSAKVGMYRINPGLSLETATQLRVLLGSRILLLVLLSLGIYRFTPALLLKGLYWLRCVTRYGVAQGVEHFQSKTRQALSTKASGF